MFKEEKREGIKGGDMSFGTRDVILPSRPFPSPVTLPSLLCRSFFFSNMVVSPVTKTILSIYFLL